MTAEDILRADQAEELHIATCHPSDSLLSSCLDQNLIPATRLTSRDVKNNRYLRGKCPQCSEGKNKRKPMKTSTTPPAVEIGHTICIDLDILQKPTPNGNKQQIFAVDEKSGRCDIAGTKSKSKSDTFQAIWSIISIYNKLGFKVVVIHVDIEGVLVSLQKQLALSGTTVIASPAEQHQQRVERYIQTMNEKTTCVLSGLPFIIPSRYILQIRSNTTIQMNKLQNSRSYPSTPYILTEQKHPASNSCAPLL